MSTTTRFDSDTAPCGMKVAGERIRERDDDGLLLDHVYFSCGCKVMHDEFHDGSVHRRVVRHDGHVLSDEREQGE